LLIERPKRLYIIGIEFKELLDEPLRNLGGRKVHPIQGTKQRQQIEPGYLQPRTQIIGNRYWRFPSHSLSIAHLWAEVNRGPSLS